MANLKIKDINKIYPGGVQAVYDCNIDIEDGEFIVLVGPSGCGKSTLLRMIAGLETITSGDLIIGDKRYNDVAPSDRDIAMVFQNYALYGTMSVYQNMGISLQLRHVNGDIIHDEVMKAAEVVELSDNLNSKPGNLSGGQRQRVALGRSIVRKAGVFLMDEPLSNLDAKLRTQTRKELVELHQKLETTFVYVTHDQTEAMTMADRIVVLNEGRVQQIGTPSELYEFPENLFVSSFIGSPPMNLFSGKIEGEYFVADGIKIKVPSDKLELLKDYNNKEVIIGIRPELFTLEQSDIDASPEAIVESTVDVVEFLGANSLVYFDIGEAKVIAKLDVSQKVEYKDNLKLAIKMDRVHFFDPKSEKRIR